VVLSSRSSTARRGQVVVLATALTCGLALVAVGVVALHGGGNAGDGRILHGFTGLYRQGAASGMTTIARVVDPLPYALGGMLCVAVALARRHSRHALAVVVVLLGAGLTTQVLKHLLAEPRYTPWLGFDQLDKASWPSGHATAAMALALSAVFVAPPRLRTATALLGGGAVVLVSYATLALAWHYPSDVLAGLLVAGLWASLTQLVLARAEADRGPAALRAPPSALLAIGGAGAIAAAAGAGLAADRAPLYPAERLSVVAAALTIAAVVLALLAATVIADPEPDGAGGRDATPSPAPAPSAAVEDGTTSPAVRARAVRADSRPRRMPPHGSSPRAR
jgi:membrane-associated phospholipid phosphatase